MSNETRTDRTASDDEMEAIAAGFEEREFTTDELAKIKRTRRRSPRTGEARAEVYTSPAPPATRAGSNSGQRLTAI